ncbi:MAG: GDSL-type esterase/lipase family protein [Tannerella sp.]|nr:GDSL-type esterase/lipase family protein [Tannerella sp.]
MKNLSSKRTKMATVWAFLMLFLATATRDKSYALLNPKNEITVNLPFIIDSLCVVRDPGHTLQHFYDNLDSLRNGKDTIINIIHIGDSHIQAGFLSGKTMRLLQDTFGNAGRGWISPLKLSGSNEPNDYFITSGIKNFISGTCIQKNPKCSWGIGGVGIESAAEKIDLGVMITPRNGAGYEFDKALLFRDINSKPLFPESDIDYCQADSSFENILVDTFICNGLISNLYIQSLETDTSSVPGIYYGFLPTNGRAGILYHALGINGARFSDFTNRKYIRQLSLLNPALIIVSLGTNESFGKNFDKSEFERQIDAFVSLIDQELSNTSILLTTPAETYKRERLKGKRIYVRNENSAKAAEVIASYSDKSGIACWDLFAASGGVNSCKNWWNAGLFAYDHIHFTQKGYEEQGKLLYKSLINSLNESKNWGKEESPDVE